MKNLQKEMRGITLILLVIIIVVILIFAGVALIIVLNGGRTDKKQNEVSLYQSTGTSTSEEISSNPIATIKYTETTINKTTTGNGYVGYYADIDGNGTIDGIIYADLLVGAPTGEWTGFIGTYTLPTVTSSEVKDYVLSATQVTDARFEKKGADPSKYTARYVVKPASTTTGKKDRFYVMGLNNITDGTNETLFWYKNSYGMIESDTSVNFGKGKDNTTTILAKLKAGNTAYGTQDNRDLWKWINVEVGQTNAGWFVPSREEWAAFGKAFDITTSNWGDFGLDSAYWSSSQNGADHA